MVFWSLTFLCLGLISDVLVEATKAGFQMIWDLKWKLAIPQWLVLVIKCILLLVIMEEAAMALVLVLVVVLVLGVE